MSPRKKRTTAKQQGDDMVDRVQVVEDHEQEQIEDLLRHDPAPDAGPAHDPIAPKQTDPAVSGLPAVGEGKVVLLNLRYINETIFLPVAGTAFSGQTAKFHEGHLVTDRATADQVKAICPYVYEEPESGEVFSHPSGFKTRIADAFAKYSLMHTYNS